MSAISSTRPSSSSCRGGDRIEVSSSQDSITFGAGVGTLLGRHINLRLEYERLDPDEFDDADALWLTAAWRFL